MVIGNVWNLFTTHNAATALLRGLILRPSGFADLTIYGAFDYLRNFDWALHWIGHLKEDLQFQYQIIDVGGSCIRSEASDI